MSATRSRPVEPSGNPTLLVADDDGWDEARRAWNLAVDQHPALVALPETTGEVASVIEHARLEGLRVAPQGTGHNPAALAPLTDTVLLRTDRLREIAIDPDAMTARVGAGVLSAELGKAAAEHGLAALLGSSPDVGVVGYALGGGISFLGRKHGLAANTIVGVELVTAAGEILEIDRDSDPDLFWAVRGGGGSFGVVTALELRLFPIREVYAGILWWPIERGREVLTVWRELTQRELPDELTLIARYLRIPPLPEIPEPIRGKSFFVVEAIHVGDPAAAEEILRPLRELGPVTDTIQTIPVTALSHLHMDPEQPVPGKGEGLLLGELPLEAVDALERVAGSESGSRLLSLEVRHLGGELGRARPENGALAAIEAEYGLYAVGMAPHAEAAAGVGEHLALVAEAMSPWTSRQQYLNFAEARRDASAFWSPQAYERLRRIKREIDPDGVIRSNHPVEP